MPFNILAKTVKDLNKSDAAHQHVNGLSSGSGFGTMLQFIPIAGSYVVTQADATGSKATVATQLDTVKGYMFENFRSGSRITATALWYQNTAGSIVVTGSGVGASVVGDVYQFIAW